MTTRQLALDGVGNESAAIPIQTIDSFHQIGREPNGHTLDGAHASLDEWLTAIRSAIRPQ
jgi:hypothetical protein